MRIGVAGPIDLTLLRDLFSAASKIPGTVSFPLPAYIARAYLNHGHEIVLFALSQDVTSTTCIRGDRITAYICPQRKPRWQMLDFFQEERYSLRDAMRTSSCDVIHAHWTYEFGLAAVESGLPHVITAHDVPNVVLRFARHPYWLEKPLLAWPVLKRARCVTAVSPYVADALRGLVKPDRDIVVVPNGVTQGIFALFKTQRPRSESAPFVFASVLNGWSGRKNGAKLIEAFAILRAEFGEQVQLSMFGEGHGPGGPACRWSAGKQLTEGVDFAGVLPNPAPLSRLAQNADVLMHPSLEESFCMAAAEAMAMGIPVIEGAKSGGISWVLDHGRAGMLVDVCSAESIAQGMRTMLRDSDRRRAFAYSGRERALKDYRLEAVATQYERVLEKACLEQTL